LQLSLAEPNAHLPEWLKTQAHIMLKAATENFAEFDFFGDLSAQATLLKEAINQDFRISSLSEHKENLQQSYLRSVAAHLESKP
jgi:ABC-2 type transport system ATP-binding protein